MQLLSMIQYLLEPIYRGGTLEYEMDRCDDVKLFHELTVLRKLTAII